MKNKVTPIPEGYNNITPYLIVKDALSAIKFYKDVFAAEELLKMNKPDGGVAHAELKIGDSKFMLADEFPKMKALSPKTIGGTPVMMHLYVDDVDAVVQKAIDAGAKLEQSVETRFYGDRSGTIEDPFGHQWCISTHVEDVSPEETQKRATALYSNK